MNETTMVARWRDGSRGGGIPAEVAAGELIRIGKAHGGISPAVVVDEARPEDAPLHPAFTWDDAIAAESYRRVETRQLIRSVEFVDTTDREAQPVPAFCSVVSEGEPPRYMATADIVTDAVLLASAQRTLQAQIKGIRGTLAGLSWLAKTKAGEHAAIVESLEGLERAVGALQVAA